MTKYKFSDIAYNIITKKKPVSGDEKTYIGLEHLDTGSLQVNRWGSDVEITGEKLVMKKGDILFGRRNTYLRRAAIAPHDGIFSAHGMIFRPKTEVVDPDYFPFFIASDYFMDEAIKISVGSLSPTVNWGTLKNLEFELPSLKKQKELAKILTAAERTRQAYKNLLQKSDELVKSRFIEMFNAEQKQLRIDEICNYFGDGDWIESKDQSDSGIRLIQTGNIGFGKFKDKDDKSRFISEDTFDRLNCTEVLPGDILISRLPDPIGRACIVPDVGKAITAVDCAIVRLKDIVLPAFFVNFTKTLMYSMQIDSLTTGSTRKRVSRANLGSIKVPIPDVDKQKIFVEFVKQIDKSKFSLQKSLDSLNNTIRSLVQQNFTQGE